MKRGYLDTAAYDAPSVKSEMQVWKTTTTAPYSFTARFSRSLWLILLCVLSTESVLHFSIFVFCFEPVQTWYVEWKLAGQETDKCLTNRTPYETFTGTWLSGTLVRIDENWTAVRGENSWHARDNGTHLNQTAVLPINIVCQHRNSGNMRIYLYMWNNNSITKFRLKWLNRYFYRLHDTWHHWTRTYNHIYPVQCMTHCLHFEAYHR